MQESNMHEIPDLEIFEKILLVHASIYLNIMIYVDYTMHFKQMTAEPKNAFLANNLHLGSSAVPAQSHIMIVNIYKDEETKLR